MNSKNIFNNIRFFFNKKCPTFVRSFGISNIDRYRVNKRSVKKCVYNGRLIKMYLSYIHYTYSSRLPTTSIRITFYYDLVISKILFT